jgi:hypothetical protein
MNGARLWLLSSEPPERGDEVTVSWRPRPAAVNAVSLAATIAAAAARLASHGFMQVLTSS